MKNIRFIPQDIILKDDAIHKKGSFGKIETWYYDAIFENNYSIVALINVIHLGLFTKILVGLYFYKDNKLIYQFRKNYSKRLFFSSEDTPIISINNKQVLNEFIQNNSLDWITKLSLGEDDWSVELNFKKITKPWKGKTFLGYWLAIPRFIVDGFIICNNKRIQASGEGYHDHNLYPIYSPLTTKGYHFGKISFDSLSITWANVIKNRKKHQPIIVVNYGDKYFSVNPENINFEIVNEKIENKKEIPLTWKIIINDDKIKTNLLLDSIQNHYVSIPSVNYWRYHVGVKGKIFFNKIKEDIDKIEIAEYLKFF